MRFPKSLSIGIRVPSLPGLHARSMSPLLNAALVAAYWLMINRNALFPCLIPGIDDGLACKWQVIGFL